MGRLPALGRGLRYGLSARGLAIDETVSGPDHPEVAASLTNLATIDGLLGDHATARARHARALAIFERSLGPDHPDLAVPLVNLGETLLEQHDPAAAGRMFTRARTISEKALGPNHEFVARAVLGLADVAVAEAHPSEAIALTERAEQIGTTLASPDVGRRARLIRADALWLANRRPAAHALATALKAEIQAAGDDATRLSHVDAWLREHEL